MKTGLIIGKFMPLHMGHIQLIDFGLERCDQLIIALVTSKMDSIPMAVRLEWLNWLRETRENISIEIVEENLPQTEALDMNAASVWIEYFGNRFKHVNVIFSSETYGKLLADEMGISHICYDLEREKVNISGTEIRMDPMAYLEHIPQPVRDYFTKKINTK